ncbi:MAG TPA: pyridoxamine 5'-phosphate oxidase family protein [Anaerolineales bacterium]
MADRPNMPGYGIQPAEGGAGLLPWSQLSAWFAKAHNYWVAVATPDQRPHATPVWGLWHGEQFYFSVGDDSRKGISLRANPAIVVHLESGDEVAILEGTVDLIEDETLMAILNDAYQEKYGFGMQTSPVYVVKATKGYVWREADFPSSATRFTLGDPEEA